MTSEQSFSAREAADLATIRAEVRQLVHHPRFQGKMFGETSALELLYCLRIFLDAQPEVKWPGRTVETP